MVPGTAGEATTDGYTQRDIRAKGAGRRLAADAAPGVPLAPWSLRAGGCHAWIASQVHARSIAGTCQVHHAAYPGSCAADMARFCGPQRGPAGGAPGQRWAPGGA